MKTFDAIVDAVAVKIPGPRLEHVAVGDEIMRALVIAVERKTGVAGLSVKNRRLVYRDILFVEVEGYGSRRIDAVYHKSLTEEVAATWGR